MRPGDSIGVHKCPLESEEEKENKSYKTLFLCETWRVFELWKLTNRSPLEESEGVSTFSLVHNTPTHSTLLLIVESKWQKMESWYHLLYTHLKGCWWHVSAWPCALWPLWYLYRGVAWPSDGAFQWGKGSSGIGQLLVATWLIFSCNLKYIIGSTEVVFFSIVWWLFV